MENKSLAKNAIYKTVLNVFNLFVPLLVNLYISRLFDRELFGMYNRVYSQFQVFFTFAALGIYTYGVREISKVREDKEKVNKIFTSLFLIGVISNLVVAVFYIFYFMHNSSGIDLYVYMAMLIQIMANIFYIEFINEAVENFGFITKKTIIVRVFYLLAMFLFVRKPTDVIIYALIINITVFVNNIISYKYLRRDIRFNFRDIEIGKHLIPLFIAAILTNVEILYSQFDRLMIADLLGDIAIGRYNTPYLLVGMIATIPLSLVSVAVPRLGMYVGANDKENYIKVLNSTINMFMAMLIPICFGIFVLSKEIMLIYAGDKWVDAYTVLMVAAIARIAFGYQTLIMNLVMYVNSLEKQMVFILAVFGFVNVGSNYLLVVLGIFTPETALATTALSCLLFDIVAYVYTRKVLNIQYKLISKRILGYFAICFAFIPISLLIRAFDLGFILTLCLIIMLCTLTYTGYLVITKDKVFHIILEKFKLDKLMRKLRRKA